MISACARAQFVRVDDERIGLLSRDVPGGKPARVAAGNRVAALLGDRGRGLSQFHAHTEVSGISAVHRRWTPQLTGSVLRADGRFRLSHAGTVGLAIWESVRLASKVEIFRRALTRARPVKAETVLAEIGGEHGRARKRVLERPYSCGRRSTMRIHGGGRPDVARGAVRAHRRDHVRGRLGHRQPEHHDLREPGHGRHARIRP